tara:strand:+ start:424 stop:615 length:192 start_codon:yes stop_codon:yes gene_type:complete
MIYFIFIALGVGIITFRFARKLQWSEYLRRRRKENKERWVKKEKEKPYGNGVSRSSSLSNRKK